MTTSRQEAVLAAQSGGLDELYGRVEDDALQDRLMQTLKVAFAKAGVDVLGSCMEGICGTCEADVLEGTPDHRDSVLSKADRERGATIMTCVSRSLSKKLVLDV